MGARERLNGREKMARRKVKNGEKKSSRRSLLFFAPFFPARLVFPLPPLSAPGSPRMREIQEAQTTSYKKTKALKEWN